jgi:hypothetical protein
MCLPGCRMVTIETAEATSQHTCASLRCSRRGAVSAVQNTTARIVLAHLRRRERTTRSSTQGSECTHVSWTRSSALPARIALRVRATACRRVAIGTHHTSRHSRYRPPSSCADRAGRAASTSATAAAEHTEAAEHWQRQPRPSTPQKASAE